MGSYSRAKIPHFLMKPSIIDFHPPDVSFLGTFPMGTISVNFCPHADTMSGHFIRKGSCSRVNILTTFFNDISSVESIYKEAILIRPKLLFCSKNCITKNYPPIRNAAIFYVKTETSYALIFSTTFGWRSCYRLSEFT